ncbi:MAG: hypothetical protein PHC28_13725 [Flavobacterium sp.]|uniref:hypothetical protein n=1 Tax=Flavobacterium sp. TaxID=239 RepID=UPI00262948C5|nr:hypothetical protein [Flavobacterium sp.]MDD5151512.1 hypothetical protein [Flavobacterium sp.]
MGKQTIELLTCDICHKDSKAREDIKKWLQWSRENLYVDRDWIDHCICPSCLEDISEAIKNKQQSTRNTFLYSG